MIDLPPGQVAQRVRGLPQRPVLVTDDLAQQLAVPGGRSRGEASLRTVDRFGTGPAETAGIPSRSNSTAWRKETPFFFITH